MSQSVQFTFAANTDAAVKNLQALREVLISTQDAAKSFGESLKGALSNLREVMTGQDMSGIKQAARELRSATSDLQRVRASSAHGSSPTTGGTSAAPSSSGFGAAAGVAAGAAAAAVSALASAAAAAAAALKDLALDAVQSAISSESAQTRFRGLLGVSGDSASADAVMSRAHDYANATGVFGDDKAIISKISDLVKTGMDAATAQIAVEAAHNASLGDASQADALLSLISRAQVSGSVNSARELRSSGLPLAEALQSVLGTDAGGLDEAFKNGAVSADALVAAVARVASSMGDTMDALNETTESKIAQLKNVWDDILTEFATPLLDVIKPAVDALKAAAQAAGPMLAYIGAGLKATFEEVATALRAMAGYLEPMMGPVKTLLAAQWSVLASVLQGVFSVFKALTPVMQLCLFVLQPLQTAMAGLAKTVSWVLDQISSAIDWFTSKLGYSFSAPSAVGGSAPAQQLSQLDASPVEERAKAAADEITAAKEQEKAAKEQEKAAKEQEKAAAAAQKAAEESAKAAERELQAKMKIAAANADYERQSAILDAKLAGNDEQAHLLELASTAEALARSMEQQGIDSETARQRAAELTAKRKAVAVAPAADGSPTRDAQVMRMSEVSGNVQWTMLKTPMQAQQKSLVDIQGLVQKIVEVMQNPGESRAAAVLS